MTLLQRWKDISREEIIKETRMLFQNCRNAVQLFTVDENMENILYCVDHSGNTGIETYGKKTAVCISESTARDSIEHVLTEFAFLLIPFFQGDMPTLDFGVSGLPEPIGFYRDEDDEEKLTNNAIFVFEKCNNIAGFCISKIIPLR